MNTILPFCWTVCFMTGKDTMTRNAKKKLKCLLAGTPIKGGATQNIFSWQQPLGGEPPKKHLSLAFLATTDMTQPDHQYL